MLSRNTYLLAVPAECYVDDDDPDLETKENIIDCALGTNPWAQSARKAFDMAAKEYCLSSYPQPWARELKEAIAVYWQSAGITAANIILGAGSMGILHKLTTLFLAPGSGVLGFAPQFADYVRAARTRGAKYKGVVLTPPELKMSAAKLLEHLNQDTAVVYRQPQSHRTSPAFGRLRNFVAQAQRLAQP